MRASMRPYTKHGIIRTRNKEYPEYQQSRSQGTRWGGVRRCGYVIRRNILCRYLRHRLQSNTTHGRSSYI